MIVNAARFELSHVSMPIREKTVAQFNKISHDLAQRVADGIGVSCPAADPTYYHNNVTAGLSIFNNTLTTIAGLNIGILATTKTNSSITQAASLSQAFKAKGANGHVIAEVLATGVDTTYTASDAVLFDGIIVVDGTEGLFNSNSSTHSTFYPAQRPLNIVRDAFYYGKPVGSFGTGKAGLNAASIHQQAGVYQGTASIPEFVTSFEAGLKQFKFLDRFPIDQ